MAAYEVLLLNTAIPQIQAAQSGDTYVVPRDIAINATAIISANSATDALRITQTGAGNAILVEDSANPDSTPFVVTAVGDVGIGTSSPGSKLQVESATSTTNAKVVSALSGSLFYSAFEVARSGVSAGALMRSARNASAGGVGWEWMTTADNTAEINGTYSSRMILDSSGNLGLGVPPSTGGYGIASQIAHAGNGGAITAQSISANNYPVNLTANAISSGASTWKYFNTDASSASRYQQVSGVHSWHTAASGNAGDPITFTQAMTLLANGNLGIGETNPAFKLQVIGNSQISLSGAGTQQALQLNNNDTTAGTQAVKLAFSSSSVTKSSINCAVYGNDYMTFNVGSDTERARITSGGYFKASNDGVYDSSTGAYHEVRQTANDLGFLVSATNSAFTNVALRTKVTVTAAGTGFYHIDSLDSAATRIFGVRGDGNTYNTNGTFGTFSDQKLKQDIGDVESQWDDIKAIRFRKYRLKSQVAANPDAPALLGVVAQELEQTSPGLVDETPDRDADGNDLGTTTKSVKTSVLLMKAAVALQEAMARIETLEAEVAALKGA